MRGLKEKVFVLAGAGSGIGMTTAIRLAEEGATVAIGDIDGGAADALAARINADGGRAIGVQFDISDDASVKNLFDTTVAQLGGIDGALINAAEMRAIMSDGDALDVELAVFDRTIAVNLRGHLLCTRHALPALLERGGGSIVYTSSAAAFVGEPTRVAYGISKGGLNALMRHVASRWGRENIRANAVAPGFVPTEKTRDSLPPEFIEHVLAAARSPRMGETGDIAAMITLLLSEDGSWINGQAISVDGGSTLR